VSLWTSEELCTATGGAIAARIVAGGVSIDTRSLAPGDLFVALRDRRDGHDFVAEALARGAAAAMVERDVPGLPPGAPLLRVADTLAGLTALGVAARARSAARFVAVTGSVGKTTTKEMLRHGLSAIATTHASVASYNNHWGVPLTLARTPRDAAHAVIEIGMNNRGEIAPLARLARPEVAVITAIAPAHIGQLGSIEAIVEEKADICAGLAPGGVAVLPMDSRFFARLSDRAREAGARVLGFGEHPEAFARIEDIVEEPERVRATLHLGGAAFDLRIASPGRHLAQNAAAAGAAAAALGADAGRFVAALAFFAAGAGRGARETLRMPGGTAMLLDESYNASTASIRAALAVLAAQPAARRVAVLGDMLELGSFGPALHEELAPDAARAADVVHCCGPLMQRLHAALPESRRGLHAPDAATLATLVAADARPGDAVLVKGSLGMRMAQVVQALKGLSS
jgi:UDP-N-acetylmuramoyl-tripeptide--D-alanyl-D-alanine ligase